MGYCHQYQATRDKIRDYIHNFKIVRPVNDSEIRCALLFQLHKQRNTTKKFKIIEELHIDCGQARIDLAVIDNKMVGYEIKSDFDSFTRLPNQLTAYNGMFDKIILVVGVKHVVDAIHLVPDWWGIILAKTNHNNNLDLHLIREPKNNMQISSLALTRLLWRTEALSILSAMHKARGVRGKPREIIYERLATCMKLNKLQKQVRAQLCRRAYRQAD